MQMTLNEAIETLNDFGFIAEGRLGRIIGAGALALGLAAGNANALTPDQIANFQKQTEQSKNSADVKYVNGKTIKSFIKNGNYYFTGSDRYNDITVIFSKTGKYVKIVKSNLRDGRIIKYKGTYENHTKHSLEDFVSNFDLISDDWLSLIVSPNNDGFYTDHGKQVTVTLEKAKSFVNDKAEYETEYKNGKPNKCTYFDDNGEVERMTIYNNQGRAIKTMCSDGSIQDGYGDCYRINNK